MLIVIFFFLFFFSSRRRHTRCLSDWSSDVCSSDLEVRHSASSVCIIPAKKNSLSPTETAEYALQLSRLPRPTPLLAGVVLFALAAVRLQAVAPSEVPVAGIAPTLQIDALSKGLRAADCVADRGHSAHGGAPAGWQAAGSGPSLGVQLRLGLDHQTR